MGKTWLILACLAPALLAQDAAEPFAFFPGPDRAARREIQGYLKDLQDAAWQGRSGARANLVRVGPWAVLPLVKLVVGRDADSDKRVRMNAILALVRIGDARGHAALRQAAKKDSEPWVRRTAILGLGELRRAEDAPLLKDLLSGSEARMAALAYAVSPVPAKSRAAGLLPLIEKPERDKQHESRAAGRLLAAAVATPDARESCFRVLVNAAAGKLLRRTAAAGLLLRPFDAEQTAAALRLLGDPRERDPDLRALVVQDLSVAPPSDTVRARLFKLATADHERSAVRIQAALAFAGMAKGKWTDAEYLRIRGEARANRNDPAVATLLFILAASGRPEAIHDLIRKAQHGSSFLQAYAVGTLVHLVAFAPQPRPDETRIFDALRDLRTTDPSVTKLLELARALRSTTDRKERARAARKAFSSLPDPRNLHLFDWTPRERREAVVNDALNEVLGVADALRKIKANERQTSSPEEQDLAAFLAERPFFLPGDLP